MDNYPRYQYAKSPYRSNTNWGSVTPTTGATLSNGYFTRLKMMQQKYIMLGIVYFCKGMAKNRKGMMYID